MKVKTNVKAGCGCSGGQDNDNQITQNGAVNVNLGGNTSS
jgi:hypothetical protein